MWDIASTTTVATKMAIVDWSESHPHHNRQQLLRPSILLVVVLPRMSSPLPPLAEGVAMERLRLRMGRSRCGKPSNKQVPLYISKREKHKTRQIETGQAIYIVLDDYIDIIYYLEGHELNEKVALLWTCGRKLL